MYAIKNGLGAGWKWLGTAFAIFGGLAGFGIGNMVQANSITDAVHNAFGFDRVYIGIVLLLITAAVVLGGIKRIAMVADVLVPFKAGAYLLGGLAVLYANASAIPGAFKTIVTTAFTGTAATGGFVGAAVLAAMRYGVARGVFANEAGLGTAGIAQAAGASNNTIKSGLIGMMGTFLDTFVVCTVTALVIVVSGVWTTGKTGAELTQLAFETGLPGFGGIFVAIALSVFALTTIFGWGYYGERCWQFLLGKWTVMPYRVLWTIGVFVGSVVQLDLAWTLADVLNALMAIPNLISLLMLSPVIVKLTREQVAGVVAAK
jgi:AGCS family alanine or glycine:cation symporter